MKTLFSLASPGGAKGRLTVLIFHRVHAQPDPLFPGEVDRVRFDELLGWVRQWFQVLPLPQAIAQLRDGSLPPRAAALTFDDGYADNHDEALPLLQKHGLPCSFFIASDFLDGGRMWNDTLVEAVRRCATSALDLRGLPGLEELGCLPVVTLDDKRAAIAKLIARSKYLLPEPRLAQVNAVAERAAAELPVDLMMRSEQVKALHDAGMQIGGHTCSHPILARLDAQAAADEIERNQRLLARLLGEAPQVFAYPNGKPGEDYRPDRDPGIVRELGYAAAVSTSWGAARRDTDPFQIPRFLPWDRQRWRFGARLLRNLATS